jgi:hypothetical protein
MNFSNKTNVRNAFETDNMVVKLLKTGKHTTGYTRHIQFTLFRTQ